MRIVAVLLLSLLAPTVLAQPCDPAQTDEVCPDTTDWHRYFPLDVGNVWHYYEHLIEEPENRWSWTITGEAEVEGQSYVTLERCDDLPDGSAACEAPVLLRYDDEHDMVVRRTDSGDVWWDEVPCRLSVDFNESFPECTGPGTEEAFFTRSEGAYEASVSVPPDVLSDDTRKSFAQGIGTAQVMYAGLGMWAYYLELQSEPPELVYAHVGGEQVGTPAFASCDPSSAEDVPCPDTTDWRSYFPLSVGNEWQYELSKFCGAEGFPPCRSGSEIVGSEVVEDTEYFLIRRCTEGLDGEVACGGALPIRYDEELRTVVFRAEDGMTYPYLDVCSLALPFGFSVECNSSDEEDFEWDVIGRYGATFDLGAGPTLIGTAKGFGSLGGGVSYFAGIGETSSQGDGSSISNDLTYARIDGVEYGTPAFTFPTSSEPDIAQPVVTGFTAAFPNPARGSMQAQYALAAAQTVTLELVDLLGRRVRETALGPQAAGAHDVEIDLGGLRPGLYVLRLRGDAGAEATRRVVVVQ
jgi:hypothetical protein